MHTHSTMPNGRLDSILQFPVWDSLGGERKLKTDLDNVATDLVVVCVDGDYGRQVDV